MKSKSVLSLLLIFCLFLPLVPRVEALTAPSVAAEAIVLADLDSGSILYEKNMHVQRPPASLTKIMTGLLAVEAVERGDIGMDTVITAPTDCWTGLDSDSSNAEISPGEQMTFGDYLYCALVKSANEACNVIASAVAGNIQNFVNRMNTRAAELGAGNTYFSDTNGLSSTRHYTTAYDLFLISREAMRHELFAEIVDTLSYEIPPTNIHKTTRILKNSNALICQDGVYGDDYLYPGAAGVKTGYTSVAGYCLVSTAQSDDDDIHLLAVLLGCGGPLNTGEEDYGNFSGTIRLYNWAFRNFVQRPVVAYGEEVTRVPAAYSKGNAPAVLRSTEEITLLLPKDMEEDSIQIVPEIQYKELTAPIPAGTVLGTAKVLIDGKPYATVKLATAEAVEQDKTAYYKAKVKETLSIPWVKPALAATGIIFLVVLFLIIRYKALRRRHLQERAEKEERRRLEEQREASLAESRAVQEDMMRFRQTLPPEKNDAPLSSSFYRVKAQTRDDDHSEDIASLFHDNQE
ncbi:MAG: D-alanyl-D-alanine carboxypeptidase [Oscillospiraceae bacterium]|nr:D-alanyl-D-alanine carboxypeptidase [Oscillospiraceae bacterium]